MALNGYGLTLVPSSGEDKVPTFFWWDNFDCKKENAEGSIHTTHGIGFQEQQSSIVQRPAMDIEVSKKRTMEKIVSPRDRRKINPHKNPARFCLLNKFTV